MNLFERIPEPPLMEDQEQCEFYNQEFIEDPDCLSLFILKYRSFIKIEEGTIIDLGSGSCNFVIELCKTYPNINVVCYEGSREMIKIANKNISENGLENRIRLVHDDFFNASGEYDAVLASRVLHHVNDTDRFWKLVNSLSKNVLICDLERPEKLEDILESFPIDLKNSFMAAYTVDEVSEQIKSYPYKIIKEMFTDKISAYNVFTNKDT